MIFVISDTHIDPGDGRFTPVKKDFHDFLDMVGDSDLLINGDCFELWAWPLEAIMNGLNRDVIDRLTKKENVRLNLGNHDLYPKEMRSVFQGDQDISMVTKIGPWTLMHGHQLDPDLDTVEERWVVSKLARIVQWLNCPWINNIRDSVTRANNSNSPLIQALVEKGGKYILGHSHTPIDLGWFVNDGCWLAGHPLTYCTIDEENEYEVQLKEFKGGSR